MTTIYSPNPAKFANSDVVWNVPNDVLTAEIEDARQHLARAIEAKGEDYVYLHDSDAHSTGGQNCLYLRYERVESSLDTDRYYTYINPQHPSCIVGHVLVYAETPFDQITPHEGDNAWLALRAIGTYTSTIVIQALHMAQQKQDHANGYTWGEAVEEFEAYINERTVKTDV